MGAGGREGGSSPASLPSPGFLGAAPLALRGGSAGCAAPSRDGGSGKRRGGGWWDGRDIPLNEQLVAWPPFRTGGLILPAGATQPRSLVAKLGGGGGESRAGAALGSAAPGSSPRLCAGLATRTGLKPPPPRGKGVPPALGWRPRHIGVNRAAAGRSS